MCFALGNFSEPGSRRGRASLIEETKGPSFLEKLNLDAIPLYLCMEDTVCALQLAQLASIQFDKTEGKLPTRKGGRPITFSGRPTTQSGFPKKNWSARVIGGLHTESKPMVGWETKKCGPKTK